MKSRLAPILLAVAFWSAPAFAEEPDCSASCPTGEKLVSYADGNTASCSCVEEAQMEETIPDPSVAEGDVNEGT